MTQQTISQQEFLDMMMAKAKQGIASKQPQPQTPHKPLQGRLGTNGEERHLNKIKPRRGAK